MRTTWRLYKTHSKRIAQLVGSFYSDIRYAQLIQKRACQHWQRTGKRGQHPLRTDKYRVFIGSADTFREGW